MKVRKAIIPAGGLGTRFLPATKSIPKEMFPIVDTPILEILVRELAEAGIEQILIILGKGKECIIEHFSLNAPLQELLKNEGKTELAQKVSGPACLADMFYKRQSTANGFADALSYAESFVGEEPVVVLVGDELFYNEDKSAVKQLLECYEKYDTSVLAVKKVKREEIYRYGNVAGESIAEGIFKVENIIEKPKEDKIISEYVAIGKYVLDASLFKRLQKRFSSSEQKEFTDYLTELAHTQGKGLLALDLQGKRYDTGNVLGYLQANIEYGLRDREIGEALALYLKNLVKELE